jgi:menaquinone-dependent protoporphyrinogen IX oxidase
VRAVVVYESLTGNTARAAELIAAELEAAGVTATACPVTRVDLQALSQADLVVVGSWVDGFILFGQRPGRTGRLARLPVIDGKTAAVYCTYAVDPGRTLDKLAGVVRRRGGEVIGGYAIKRGQLAEGAREFVDRLLAALDHAAPAGPAEATAQPAG